MKPVKIADLKAHLSEHLRTVEAGAIITVFDRQRPIAQIVPFRGVTGMVEHQPPTRSIQDFVVPRRVTTSIDIVEDLLEERRQDRGP